MTRSTLDLPDVPSAAHPSIRAALPADGHALGEVLFLAYLGGPDQEENDEGEGRAEIARTMGGAYGPFVEAASFVAEDAEGPGAPELPPGDVTATGRKRPDAMCGPTVRWLPKENCTCPAMRSVRPGAIPL